MAARKQRDPADPYQLLDADRHQAYIREQIADWKALPRGNGGGRKADLVLEEFEDLLEGAIEQTERPAPPRRPKNPADGVEWSMRLGWEFVRFHCPKMAEAIGYGDTEGAALHGYWLGWAQGLLQTWPEAYHGARRERDVNAKLRSAWQRGGRIRGGGPARRGLTKVPQARMVEALQRAGPQATWCRRIFSDVAVELGVSPRTIARAAQRAGWRSGHMSRLM